MALAGPLAEQLFAGYADDVRAMMCDSAWARDRANAENHLRACCRRLDDAALKASQLVAEHLPRITRIAAALAEEGELSGARIEALIYPSRASWRLHSGCTAAKAYRRDRD